QERAADDFPVHNRRAAITDRAPARTHHPHLSARPHQGESEHAEAALATTSTGRSSPPARTRPQLVVRDGLKAITMAIKEGWTGRFYEDFEVGDVYPHPLGRTILAADNVWFSLLTMNTNPLHFDYHYSAKTEFKKPLVDSCLTLAILTGQSV